MSFPLQPSRTGLILQAVIEEFIASAEPVASKDVADRAGLEVSPATVRNEMMTLETDGFLRAPHTSAGRVPTLKGYAYYLEHCLRVSHALEFESMLREAVHVAAESQMLLRAVARLLAQASGETAMVAFAPGWSYYTGVSNLLRKPDFHDLDLVHAVSETFDRMEEHLEDVFSAATDTPQVMLGEQSPFGQDVATIIVSYATPRLSTGVLALVGPTRMDYGRNIGLVESAKEALQEIPCSKSTLTHAYG